MHPELLKRTVQACRDYMDAGDCHGEPPPVERLIDAVVQLAAQIPQMLVRREEYDALSPAARERLRELAEGARRKAAADYSEGRARLAGVSLGTPDVGAKGPGGCVAGECGKTDGMTACLNSRAAMEKALDALRLAENYSDHPLYEKTMTEAIDALRRALVVEEPRG